MVTSRSPACPSRRATPLPRARRTRPLGVPGGTRRVTAPSIVGTRRSVPSTASAIGDRHGQRQVVPATPEQVVAADLDHARKGRRPGRRARPARPARPSRMRCPSATPGGNRTVSVRVLVTPPVPRHSGHFSSTTVPTPWHSRHGSEKLNEPWLRVTSPAALALRAGRGSVPGLAPLPWQVSHTPGARSVSGSVAPRTASPKLEHHLGLHVAAARRSAARPARRHRRRRSS